MFQQASRSNKTFAQGSFEAVWKKLGVPVYGAGALLLGAIGLVSGDFAAVWQPVPAGLPGRRILAYLTALYFLFAGAAIQSRKLARAGAFILGALFLIFGLLWLPRVVAYPQIFGTWGGVFEQLELVAAAIALYAAVERAGAGAKSVRLAMVARLLYGVCLVAFGFNHFFAIPETAKMVPAGLPPSQHFWAVLTGVFHLAAGVAVLTGVLDVLAARLETAMLLVFGAFVWLPLLMAHPSDHMTWCGNAINLVMAGGAWVLSSAVMERRRHSERETTQAAAMAA